MPPSSMIRRRTPRQGNGGSRPRPNCVQSGPLRSVPLARAAEHDLVPGRDRGSPTARRLAARASRLLADGLGGRVRCGRVGLRRRRRGGSGHGLVVVIRGRGCRCRPPGRGRRRRTPLRRWPAQRIASLLGGGRDRRPRMGRRLRRRRRGRFGGARPTRTRALVSGSVAQPVARGAEPRCQWGHCRLAR
jgi:hypothetical protein